jgi:hypothetical protein
MKSLEFTAEIPKPRILQMQPEESPESVIKSELGARWYLIDTQFRLNETAYHKQPTRPAEEHRHIVV